MIPGMTGIGGLIAAAAGGGAPFIVGQSTGTSSPGGLVANRMIGSAFTVPQTGILDTMHITNANAFAGSGDWRLVIYAATSATVWGAKLAETAVSNGIGLGATVSLPLISPLAVTAGDLIAICLHNAGGMRVATLNVAGGNRAFVDTFSDGAMATAGTTSTFFPSAIATIWASGSS